MCIFIFHSHIVSVGFLILNNPISEDLYEYLGHTSLSRSFSCENSEVSDDVRLWFSSEEESVDDTVDIVVGADAGDSRGSFTSWSGHWLS